MLLTLVCDMPLCMPRSQCSYIYVVSSVDCGLCGVVSVCFVAIAMFTVVLYILRSP